LATSLTAEFIRRLPVPVGRITSVLRIVLKLTSLLAVKVVVPIEIIVVVYVDISAVPIAIAPVPAPSAPSGGPERDPRAPR
jgi:hypothetical protein